MRPIKFRGKRIDNGKWVEGYYRYTATGNHVISVVVDTPPTMQDPMGDMIELFHQVDPPTVGQFTGLQDKNGVDIFEGDKWECHDYAGTIEFIDGCFMCMCGKEMYARAGFTASELAITGNIHDTPSEKGE